tara:strand:- start:6282 stop:6686 length:405 start_codon:yes stop_codon:yes gene_type:complete
MLDNCTIYPDVLPSVVEKFKDKFYEKSSKLGNMFSPSLDATFKKSSVIEWEDGWAQFNLSKNRLIVHSMFSNSSTTSKFEYLYRLAKELGKKEIIFETERNPKSWIRLIDSAAKNLKNKSKAKLISYTMVVQID